MKKHTVNKLRPVLGTRLAACCEQTLASILADCSRGAPASSTDDGDQSLSSIGGLAASSLIRFLSLALWIACDFECCGPQRTEGWPNRNGGCEKLTIFNSLKNFGPAEEALPIRA